MSRIVKYHQIFEGNIQNEKKMKQRNDRNIRKKLKVCNKFTQKEKNRK
jgi:hypothetical protein